MSWRRIVKSGDPFIWLTGGALGLSLAMVAGLLLLIVSHAITVFWPAPLLQLRLQDGSVLLGSPRDTDVDPENPQRERLQLQVGNRDLYGADFRWVDRDQIAETSEPVDAVTIERREWGTFQGFLKELRRGDETVASGAEATWQALAERLPQARVLASRIAELEALTHAAEYGGGPSISAPAAAELERLQSESRGDRLLLATIDGQEKELPLVDVVRLFQPNRLGVGGKLKVYGEKVWEFVSAAPRESNTEGGIFPALFGTVMMVMIMTIAVVPFGVLAALYLREYARQGFLVRMVRIAVNNLAGVPSIVFGVFGLGFFVYFVGGSIDALFFSDRLPTPTFGTGGILWASLTLALLTVPVVVVATEEALAAVPREHREASLALGATKFETIWRVVLPNALPGVLTGLILAMARAAGEVAPLMITGVVKLAPTLPFDTTWPFLHLDRKFMHLGFHIYDVGFQSPNVEAAKPMVYATTLLLVLIVISLNLGAIVIRNRLRRRYAGQAF